jgi:hypothetical protein
VISITRQNQKKFSWASVRYVRQLFLRMELNTRDSGSWKHKQDKAVEHKFGLMAPCTKDTGSMVKHQVKVV